MIVVRNYKSAKRKKVCHLCKSAKVQKGRKSVTFALVSIYGTYYGLTIEKVSTGMVDEKVTVISSFLTLLIFLLLKLGTHSCNW
jgi:hypothetical protein